MLFLLHFSSEMTLVLTLCCLEREDFSLVSTSHFFPTLPSVIIRTTPLVSVIIGAEDSPIRLSGNLAGRKSVSWPSSSSRKGELVLPEVRSFLSWISASRKSLYGLLP